MVFHEHCSTGMPKVLLQVWHVQDLILHILPQPIDNPHPSETTRISLAINDHGQPSRKFICLVYRRWASPMAFLNPSSVSGTAIMWTWFDIRQYRYLTLLAPFGHKIYIHFIVFITEKCLLPTVASLGYVMRVS